MRNVLLFILLIGCGGGATAEPRQAQPIDSGTVDIEDTATPADDSAPPPVDAPIDPSCAGKIAQPVDATWHLTFGGKDRAFNVHVPKTYAPNKKTPIVLNFHGYSSNASQQDLLAKMSAKADREGFVAVHAEGIGSSWNAGPCCGEAMNSKLDDVGFVRAMIDELESKLCVDERRIFATGMSNGGFLSHRLACELSDRIAAIAPVAGVNGMATCTPKRPVPVLHFHGTSDTLVPYLGNAMFPAVEKMIVDWAKRNGCSEKPREIFRAGDSHCQTYDTCLPGSEVTLCIVDGGGHTWPGGTPVPTLGYTTTFISATEKMWTFFVAHPM